MIHFIAKMVQVGFTEILIALMDDIGCGKSSLCDVISFIIGNEYCQTVNDINHITKSFNSMFDKSIFTQVEEIVNNAGDFHSGKSTLKTLTTERNIRIEKKGVDAYMSKSHNNFMLCTNEKNPIDNRRNLIF
jgi:phage/plasmid-associated DNA primase